MGVDHISQRTPVKSTNLRHSYAMEVIGCHTEIDENDAQVGENANQITDRHPRKDAQSLLQSLP